MSKLNIVLFGPPGAGKGTQSEFLKETYQLIHLSTGDLLRGEIKAGTPLGMEAKSLIDAGKLVPDEVVIGMIRNKLQQNAVARGFIFDGFPRTTGQAEALDQLLQELNDSVKCMLALDVPEKELVERLLERGKISGRSDDQDERIIQQRIREYEEKTAPLKAFYSAQNKLIMIDGVGEIGDVTRRLKEAIDVDVLS